MAINLVVKTVIQPSRRCGLCRQNDREKAHLAAGQDSVVRDVREGGHRDQDFGCMQKITDVFCEAEKLLKLLLAGKGRRRRGAGQTLMLLPSKSFLRNRKFTSESRPLRLTSLPCTRLGSALY